MFRRFWDFISKPFRRRDLDNLLQQTDEQFFPNLAYSSFAFDRFTNFLFAEIRRTESLITNFVNVQSVREVLSTHPRFYEVLSFEQLTARVILVTPEGQLFHVNITFKTGQQWSFELEENYIKAAMSKRLGVAEGFSEMLSDSQVNVQYYVQTWKPIK